MKRVHLFDWPSRHNVHLALPLMLVLSVGLHVGGVAAFQLVQTRAPATSERRAQVYVLTPGSPEAAAVGALLAAEDPALFSPAHSTGRDTWKLPETAYIPGFDAAPPALLAEAPPPAATTLPPMAATGPVSGDVSARSAPPARRPGTPTAIGFGPELSGRKTTPPEGFSFAVVAPDGWKTLAPAEFLIAVSPDGRLLHAFPRKSSGHDTLDRAALRYLTALRFEPAGDSEATWGTATFHWGADVLAPNPP